MTTPSLSFPSITLLGPTPLPSTERRFGTVGVGVDPTCRNRHVDDDMEISKILSGSGGKTTWRLVTWSFGFSSFLSNEGGRCHMIGHGPSR